MLERLDDGEQGCEKPMNGYSKPKNGCVFYYLFCVTCSCGLNRYWAFSTHFIPLPYSTPTLRRWKSGAAVVRVYRTHQTVTGIGRVNSTFFWLGLSKQTTVSQLQLANNTLIGNENGCCLGVRVAEAGKTCLQQKQKCNQNVVCKYERT